MANNKHTYTVAMWLIIPYTVVAVLYVILSFWTCPGNIFCYVVINVGAALSVCMIALVVITYIYDLEYFKLEFGYKGGQDVESG